MIETSRLILRQWGKTDMAAFADLNADPDVMRFFPAPLTRQESDSLAERFRDGIEQRGWGFGSLNPKKRMNLLAVSVCTRSLINFHFLPVPKLAGVSAKRTGIKG